MNFTDDNIVKIKKPILIQISIDILAYLKANLLGP